MKNQGMTRKEVLMTAGGVEVEKFWAGRNISDNISEYEKLAYLILCIPFRSVENERRFSAMNLVATKLRNRLKADHLNTCLRIAATPQTVRSFPFQDAPFWNGRG